MRLSGAALLILLLGSGCDFSFSLFLASGEDPPSFSATTGSDPATDGDVRQDGAVTTASVVFCGFDPAVPPPRPEYRGFLSFPLGGIPPGAFIESAGIAVHVDRVNLPAGGTGASLAFEHVHFGDALGPSAFDSAGLPVRSIPSGAWLVSAPLPQRISVDVAAELQADVSDPFLGFFQVRLSCSGGLVQVVDGAGNRAGGAPRDPALAPFLSVRYR